MSDIGGVQEVGARLVLLDSAAFKAKLQQATDAVAEFNKEQERVADLAKSSSKVVVDSAATQSSAVSDSADKQVEANTKIATSQDAVVASSTAASDKVVTASAATAVASTKAAAAHKKATDAMVAGSSKILKYGTAVGAVVVYEGVKKYLTFQQQISQLAIDAGIKKSQLPAFAKTAMQVSNATGLAATSVGDMMYRIASSNPKIGATTKAMSGLVAQAANLYVLAGNTGDYDSIGRLYGAVASNALALKTGGRAIAFSAAGGQQINQWALATVGHGDMKTGDLVAAMGTGILPLAKTAGMSLNQVGAALDVLSPAMNASSASTRLKTAIGMLFSPSQKAAQAYELFGGNVTTAGSILRSKGLGSLLSYLSGMTSGRVTGSTFTSAFYGGGLGSVTGGTKGVGSGAGEYLRVLGFTPAQARVMEGPGGVSAFGKMSPAQLTATGFARGTTGAQAVQSVQAAIVGGMFGGGHTGAAIMQLMNERGTYAGKLGAINVSETSTSYNAALKLAFSEPKVQLAKFGASLSNLTTIVGQDLTPTVVTFSNDLLGVGQWFGKNKWAVEAVLGGAGLVYAGAAVVKTVSVASKIAGGIKSIASLGGTAPLTGSLGLNTAAVNANTLALGGKLPKSLPGDVENGGLGATPLVAAAGTVASIGAAAAAMYGIYRGANWLSGWATGFGRFASGYEGSGWSKTAPKVAQSAATRFNLAAQLTAKGQALPSWLRGELSPGDLMTIANFQRMPLGAVLPGAFGTRSRYTKAWSPASFAAQSDWAHYVGGLSPSAAKSAWGNLSARSPAQQAGLMNLMAGMHVGLGPAGTFLSSISAASKLRGPAAQGNAAFNASAHLIAASVKQADASDHMKMTAAQISAAAKEYATTLEKLITSSSDQTTAATQTESAANNLAAVTKELASTAVNLNAAAAHAATSLSPDNLHAKTTQGLKNAVARK